MGIQKSFKSQFLTDSWEQSATYCIYKLPAPFHVTCEKASFKWNLAHLDASESSQIHVGC